MTQNSIDARGDTRPALTSLRFVAVLLVFITHIAFLSPFGNPGVAAGFNDITHSAGHLGVAFFFVLSGFVLTWSAGLGDSLRGFYRRRLLKVVPTHLVVFVAAVGLMFLIGKAIGLVPYLLNLFLLKAWIWDFEISAQSPNTPIWSLSVGIFFYALFPLFFLLVRRIRRDRVWAWWVATGVLILAIPIVVGALTPSGPPSPAFEGGTWIQQKALLFFPITRLPDFLIGMLTARLVQERRFVGISVGWAAVVTAAAYIVGLFAPPIWAFAGLWAFPVALLIGAAATRDPRKPGLLESRPAIWAGEAAYAFYLVHMLFMIFVYWVLGGTPFGAQLSTPVAILFALGMIVVTLLLSRLLFVAVERPVMRRWSRSRRGPDRQPITGSGGDTTPATGDAEPDTPGRTAA